MWIFKYPRQAFEIWLAHWAGLADELVAIVTFCMWQPHWNMTVLCWAARHKLKRRRTNEVKHQLE